MDKKGRVDGLSAWKNSFLLLFANLRRRGWTTQRLKSPYFVNTPIHKSKRRKINDMYAVQESYFAITCTYSGVATTGAALVMHAECLDMVALPSFCFLKLTTTDAEGQYFLVHPFL